MPYGIQHILDMFVANLAPIMIIAGVAGLGDAETGGMIQTAMLIAGIGTLIQLFPIGRLGSGLPIVMGISFTFVTVMTGVVATYGMGAAAGAIIVGGCIEGVLGLFAQYWRRIITPIVAAVVVTSIGFSLLGVGASSFGGGSGAGVNIQPVAFLVVKDGCVRTIQLSDGNNTVDRALTMIPELVEKVSALIKKDEPAAPKSEQ